MRSLRFAGESDDEFLARAEHAGQIAKLLIEACLANRCVQDYVADPALPEWTLENVSVSPTVRVEYEQAVALGDLGSCLSATSSKHWGAGPWVMPLEPDDVFFPDRLTYIYRASSLYNRRFEQRQRLSPWTRSVCQPLDCAPTCSPRSRLRSWCGLRRWYPAVVSCCCSTAIQPAKPARRRHFGSSPPTAMSGWDGTRRRTTAVSAGDNRSRYQRRSGRRFVSVCDGASSVGYLRRVVGAEV